MPLPTTHPTAVPANPALRGQLPLHGILILAVEDSRFASEALRLMCQRSGARLRRAEGLVAARVHLARYRPDVILVDLGLGDGRGEALIADLAPEAAPPVVIGMSGDPGSRDIALRAGAAAFLDKPLPALAVFQQMILRHVPGRGRRAGSSAAPLPEADPLAFLDDLAEAATRLKAAPGPEGRVYLAGFLAGLARQSGDAELAAASATLATPGADIRPIAALLEERIAEVLRI